ncbi:MAG: 50S ribosomal protein L4 [Nitriliruptorales bacterium]
MALSVDLKGLDGKKVGTVDLPVEWFERDVNVALMHQVVTAQLANARQGTANTKSRGEIRGGGRKPWRQKGTGRARHGSIRSPMWTGGAAAHGRNRDENFTQRVNKRMKRSALASALSDRAATERVTVVRDLGFENPKTKDAKAAIDALGHSGLKVLVVLGNLDWPTFKSFRNLPEVHAITVDQLNTYDVLKSDVVMFDETALPLIGTGKRSSASDTGKGSSASDTGKRSSASDTGKRSGKATEEQEVTA